MKLSDLDTFLIHFRHRHFEYRLAQNYYAWFSKFSHRKPYTATIICLLCPCLAAMLSSISSHDVFLRQQRTSINASSHWFGFSVPSTSTIGKGHLLWSAIGHPAFSAGKFTRTASLSRNKKQLHSQTFTSQKKKKKYCPTGSIGHFIWIWSLVLSFVFNYELS